jgi:hypothetical protein
MIFCSPGIHLPGRLLHPSLNKARAVSLMMAKLMPNGREIMEVDLARALSSILEIEL